MKFIRSRNQVVGSRPGTLSIPEASPPPRITIFDYTSEAYDEASITDVEELYHVLPRSSTTWIDVQGLGNEDLLTRVGEIFSLHRLLLEDVVNVPQRPKAAEYENHLLLVTRMIRLVGECTLDREQMSIILGKHYVLTFQEKYGDVLDPVRQRIRSGAGNYS